jgi:hypothetical protein
VLSMWVCKAKLDQEKSKHVDLDSFLAQFAEAGKRHNKT